MTANGRTCQKWTADKPHSIHKYQNEQFSDGSAEDASNYCRDPGQDGYLWCYTSDPQLRWDVCDIDLCGKCMTNISAVC